MACPGAVAEWLGRGLQSLVQRFESARRLCPCKVAVSDDGFRRAVLAVLPRCAAIRGQSLDSVTVRVREEWS